MKDKGRGEGCTNLSTRAGLTYEDSLVHPREAAVIISTVEVMGLHMAKVRHAPVDRGEGELFGVRYLGLNSPCYSTIDSRRY